MVLGYPFLITILNILFIGVDVRNVQSSDLKVHGTRGAKAPMYYDGRTLYSRSYFVHT